MKPLRNSKDVSTFLVGETERLFAEARRNTKPKHEKWEKYYNRRRRDVQIKVNDWLLIASHPSSSATKRVVSKFKPKFEGPYRVVEVKNNNVVIWKAGKRLTVNVYQKERPNRRNSNAHNKQLQPQTMKWKMSGILTNHGDEDTTRRYSSSQEKQSKELQPLHGRVKVRQQEYQTKR
ncbi:uncharacterized protein TNCV_390641 [Trichonephila clavipes]|nr:uncharacterized protein TNCV_390641 [Trichonephila clavipes]